MDKRIWEPFARVVRSYENCAVWVPYYDEGDESCFMHAGTLRQAKAYVAGLFHERGLRWRRIGSNTYEYGEWVGSDD